MSDLSLALTNTAGISSVMSFWVFVLSHGFKRWNTSLFRIGFWVLALGFLALTSAIVYRGFEAGRFPLANLYESLLWFAWAVMGGYLWLSRAYGLWSGSLAVNEESASRVTETGIGRLGWLASLTAASMFLYGSWLPANQHEITPLVPALVSYWRQIHVPPLIVSYAMFFLSGLTGLAQLWAGGFRQVVVAAAATVALAVSAILLGTFSEVGTLWLQLMFVGGSLVGVILCFWLLNRAIRARKTLEPGSVSRLVGVYDDVSYRCIQVGFPLLTIGIITGGLWANHAWGSYWSWDPKESMALVTWLSYAAYIHLRVHREISSEKLSLVAFIGLLLTLLTYLGFNTLGFGGLHSYGQFK